MKKAAVLRKMKGPEDAIENDDLSPTQLLVEDFLSCDQRICRWFGLPRDHGFAGIGPRDRASERGATPDQAEKSDHRGLCAPWRRRALGTAPLVPMAGGRRYRGRRCLGFRYSSNCGGVGWSRASSGHVLVLY
jgi:hypothetical protein